MYGIFTYMYHKNQPNVGKYAIHGWYGTGIAFEKEQFNERTWTPAGASEEKAEFFRAENSQDEVHESSTKRRYRMITQLSVVADASTHSGKEMLVSCAFAPTEHLGCHAVIQHLNTGSLKRSEVDVSTLAVIAKKRKLQRMSAFRQLQAIDTQLALLSDNRLGLNAFSYTQNEEEQEKGQADEAKRKKDKQIESLLKKNRFDSRPWKINGLWNFRETFRGWSDCSLLALQKFDRYWHHVCNHVGTCLCFENVNIHQFRGAYR